MKKINFIIFILFISEFNKIKTADYILPALHIVSSFFFNYKNYKKYEKQIYIENNQNIKNYFNQNHYILIEKIFHNSSINSELSQIFGLFSIHLLANYLKKIFIQEEKNNKSESFNKDNAINTIITFLHFIYNFNLDQKNNNQEIIKKIEQYFRENNDSNNLFLQKYIFYVIKNDKKIIELELLYKSVYNIENNKNNILKECKELFENNKEFITVKELKLLEEILSEDPKYLLLDKELAKEIQKINETINPFLLASEKLTFTLKNTTQKEPGVDFNHTKNEKIYIEKSNQKIYDLNQLTNLIIKKNEEMLSLLKTKEEIIKNKYVAEFINNYSALKLLFENFKNQNQIEYPIKNFLEKTKLLINLTDYNNNSLQKIQQLAENKNEEIKQKYKIYYYFYDKFKQIKNNIEIIKKITLEINTILKNNAFYNIKKEEKFEDKNFLYQLTESKIQEEDENIKKNLQNLKTKQVKLNEICTLYKTFLENQKEINTIINEIHLIELFQLIKKNSKIIEKLTPLKNNITFNNYTLPSEQNFYNNESIVKKNELKKILILLKKIDKKYQDMKPVNNFKEIEKNTKDENISIISNFIQTQIENIKEKESELINEKNPLAKLEEKIDEKINLISKKKFFYEKIYFQIKNNHLKNTKFLEEILINNDKNNAFLIILKNNLSFFYEKNSKETTKMIFSETSSNENIELAIKETNTQIFSKIKSIDQFLLEKKQSENYLKKIEEIKKIFNFFKIDKKTLINREKAVVNYTQEKESAYQNNNFFYEKKNPKQMEENHKHLCEKLSLTDNEKAIIHFHCNHILNFFASLSDEKKAEWNNLKEKISIFLEKINNIKYAEDLVDNSELKYIITEYHILKDLIDETLAKK